MELSGEVVVSNELVLSDGVVDNIIFKLSGVTVVPDLIVLYIGVVKEFVVEFVIEFVSDAFLLSEVGVDPNGEVVESIAVVIDILEGSDVVADHFDVDSNGTILASDSLV